MAERTEVGWAGTELGMGADGGAAGNGDLVGTGDALENERRSEQSVYWWAKIQRKVGKPKIPPKGTLTDAFRNGQQG